MYSKHGATRTGPSSRFPVQPCILSGLCLPYSRGQPGTPLIFLGGGGKETAGRDNILVAPSRATRCHDAVASSRYEHSIIRRQKAPTRTRGHRSLHTVGSCPTATSDAGAGRAVPAPRPPSSSVLMQWFASAPRDSTTTRGSPSHAARIQSVPNPQALDWALAILDSVGQRQGFLPRRQRVAGVPPEARVAILVLSLDSLPPSPTRFVERSIWAQDLWLWLRRTTPPETRVPTTVDK